MKFAEKNNFVIQNADSKEFFNDLELFKKHFPNDRLNHDLARANTITYHRLDGSMLFRLLEKVSPEEILENRLKAKAPESPSDLKPEIPDDIKSEGLKDLAPESPDDIKSEDIKKKDKNKTNFHS